MLFLGLIMIVGQIMGVIKVFGGGAKRPKWLDVVVGIVMIIFLLGVFGMAND